MDIAESSGQSVWIDIEPAAVDGFLAGGTFRVVAGSIGEWDSSANGDYQYFGVHVLNPNNNQWENYAWILLGHANFWYAEGTLLGVGGAGDAVTIQVGTVASKGSWDPHIHIELFNYTAQGYFSRAYEWDGPSNAEDQNGTPACSRTSSPNPSDCNTYVTPTDAIGYVGGSRLSFSELNNPYYPDF